MPSQNDHLAAAAQNYELLGTLVPNVKQFPQWTTTVAFYTALHVVEAVFEGVDGEHTDGHGDRHKKLKSTNAYKKLWEHYRPLWNDSLIARYLADKGGGIYPVFSRYMSPEEVINEHIRHNLAQIIQTGETLLGRDVLAELKKQQIQDEPTRDDE